MADIHKNFAYSTVLTAPVTATAGTALTVQAGDGALFPTVPFNATVWPTSTQPTSTNAEIVRVTNITGDILTITRTQESSTNRSIVVGDQVAATVTNKTLTDAETLYVNLLGANTAGNTTMSGSTLGFSGINVTLSGTNSSIMNISAPATSSLSATGLVSLSTNGSTISIGVADKTFSNWEVFPAGNNTTFSSLGQNSVYFQKLKPEANYSFANFELRMSGSFVSSSASQVAAHSIRYGLYSMDGNSSYNSIATSLMAMTASFNSSSAIGFTVSQGAASYTATSNNTVMASLYSGLKHLYLPYAGSMSAGGSYAFAIHISSATTVGTSPMRIAILNETVLNNLTIGKIFATTVSASNSTFVGDYQQGVYLSTTGAMPAAVAESSMSNAISQMRLYMQLDS